MSLKTFKFCLAFAFGPLLSQALGLDTISWKSKQGILAKGGFSRDTAEYLVHSDSGGNQVNLTLSHVSTSRDLFSFSKWEIDRWGDPEGVLAQPGAWRVVSNAANDVVLGVWGYWGWDGAAGTPHLVPNETTVYELSLTFQRPVTELSLSLHGLNALLAPGSSNTKDELTAQAFFKAAPVAGVTFETFGQGLLPQGNGVGGNVNKPFGASKSYYDEGSVVLRVTEKTDKVILRFTNRAITPSAGAFANGQQPWSFSVGQLSFENEVSDRTATAIEWLPKKGQLQKPGYTTDLATTTMVSKDGGVRLNLSLEHDLTTPGLTSYSKWEIDRWGDPAGELFAPGSWQIVTSAANDVVLGLWGYWGGVGETTTIGDLTCYRVIFEFDRPVHDLVLPLHGINGFLKPANGFNSGDELEIAAFLGAVPSASPNYDAIGPAMKKVGNKLVGDFSHQIDDGISGQHMSNDGSCRAVFPQAVDRVVLTLINRAGHPQSSAFQDGLQTWSMGLGDMTFTHESTALTNLARQDGVTVSQSSTLHPHTQARHLIDGNSNGNLWDQSVSHTSFEVQPWVGIDLGAIRSIDQLILWQRTDTLAGGPLSDLVVFLSNEPFAGEDPALTEAQAGVTTWRDLDLSAASGTVVLNASGRYVRIQRQGNGALSLAEVELLGTPSPVTETFLPATPTEPSQTANDYSANPLLDQFGHFALITDEHLSGIDLEKTVEGVDLVFQRPVGLDSLLNYTLELSKDLVSWTPFLITPSASESLRLTQIDALLPGMTERGFARLQIAANHSTEVTVTKAVGWYRTICHQGFQTHGLSLTRAPLAAGRVLDVGTGLQFTLDCTSDIISEGAAYAEIMDGLYEGHRMEIAWMTNGVGQCVINGSLVGSTLAEFTEELVGASIVIRAHWSLESAFPAATFRPHRDPREAGQVLFFENGRYETYYSLERLGTPARWIRLGDVLLEGQSHQVIAPGQGVFVCQPTEEEHEVCIIGHVRDHRFQQPLDAGYHLVAEAFPLPASPQARRLDQTSGYVSGSDPTSSDTIQIWSGDVNPAAEEFASYFYLDVSQSTPFWVGGGDSQLVSQSAAMLFQPDRAVFLEIVSDRLDYHIDPSQPNQIN